MNNKNTKKIEKIQKKIEDIERLIKQYVEQKQQLVKEIEALKADTLLSACTEHKLSVNEAEKSFELFELFKTSGMKLSDMNELLSAEADKQRNVNADETNSTLSPTETK